MAITPAGSALHTWLALSVHSDAGPGPIIFEKSSQKSIQTAPLVRALPNQLLVCRFLRKAGGGAEPIHGPLSRRRYQLHWCRFRTAVARWASDAVADINSNGAGPSGVDRRAGGAAGLAAMWFCPLLVHLLRAARPGLFSDRREYATARSVRLYHAETLCSIQNKK